MHVKVQQLECKVCGCIRNERLHFVHGKHTYTNRFASLILSLSRIGTIKDAADFLHVSWDTVKDIQKNYLRRHYGNPKLKGLEYIGIDEFAVSKGDVYKTIVVNLLTGQVVYIGQGKGMDALDGFWEKVKKKWYYAEHNRKWQPLENTIAERVNGILKEEFFKYMQLTEDNINKEITNTITNYNTRRIHYSIGLITPEEAHFSGGKLDRKWEKYPYRKNNMVNCNNFALDKKTAVTVIP